MSTRAHQLAAQATEAAEIRDWQDHPDVVALRVEKTRIHINHMMWTGILLGLLFTMTSVQQFAAHTDHAPTWSISWWAAWMLDPVVGIVFLGILLSERRVAPAKIRLGARSQTSKWVLLAATYVMNTWESWATGNPAGIVLHSVPVIAVFVAAESVTDCQEKLTDFVAWAHREATTRASRKTGSAPVPVVTAPVPAPRLTAPEAVPADVPDVPVPVFRPTVVPDPNPSPGTPPREPLPGTRRRDVPPLGNTPVPPSSHPRNPSRTHPTGTGRTGITPDQELLTHIRTLIRDGHPVTPNTIKKIFGIGHARATKLLTQLTATDQELPLTGSGTR